MSRVLKSWATDSRPRRSPRLTLFKDLATMWRLPRSRPDGAPASPAAPTRLSLQQITGVSLAELAARLRVDLEVVGSDSLIGLERPFVFAVNEAGTMDHRLLQTALPRSLRPAARRLSRSLTKGRNVVVFSGEPEGGRTVGEFSDAAAELAKQYSVAIVPIGLVGAFRLTDTLKLRLTRKPNVSIRVGAPIYVRDRTIEDITGDVQAAVEHLVNEGELSWWEVERRRLGGPSVAAASMPRWRRLWEQAAPRPATPARRRIWR